MPYHNVKGQSALIAALAKRALALIVPGSIGDYEAEFACIRQAEIVIPQVTSGVSDGT